MEVRRTKEITYTKQDEPNFCMEEIISIAKSLKKRKATPTTDRVPNEAVLHIVEAVGEVLLDIYMQCCEKENFPKIWNKAEIRWIPKKKWNAKAHKSSPHSWKSARKCNQ